MSAMQSIVTAVTRRFPFFIREPAVWLIGQQCYHSLIYDFDLSDTPCIKYSISKGLGFGIVLGASIVKVPQIYKILSSQSCRGLSLSAFVLETLSYAITLAYAARNAFPFSTYGENLFLTIQNIIITLLIVWYTPTKGAARALTGSAGGGALGGLNGGASGGGGVVRGGNLRGLGLGVVATLACGYVLGSERWSPPNVLTFLLGWTIPLTVLSKAPQIFSNYNLRSTGTLSAFAVFNALAGCIARLFTTSQETGDNLVWWGYALAGALNVVLAGQMIAYWKSGVDYKGKGKEVYPLPDVSNGQESKDWDRKDL